MRVKKQGRSKEESSQPQPTVREDQDLAGPAREVNPAEALRAVTIGPRAALRPADVLALQRTYGNRAVSRMLAARNGRPATRPVLPVQPALSVGPPGDQYEREADRAAEQALKTPPVTDREPTQFSEEAEDLQRKPLRAEITSFVQRWEIPKDEEEELRKQTPVQREASTRPVAVEPGVEQAIEGNRGGGQPLPEGVRGRMERAFGADFGGVRIHADAQADRLNRSIQARAFTTRQDIFFRQGEYNPASDAGQRLIAHELTHVVQQNSHLARPEAQAQRSLITTLPGLQASIQAMLDLKEFKAATDPGKSRKAIAAIDRAIETYNALVNPSQAAKLKALDDVLQAVDAYLQDKQQNDPTNERIAPVKRFRKDVEYEKVAGDTVPSRLEFHGAFQNNPELEFTENTMVNRAAGVPSLRAEVQFYLRTTQTRKTSAILKLSNAGKLADILDNALIDDAILPGIRGFHKGDNLTDDERKAIDTVVGHSTTLATVKELFSIRFNLDQAEIKALPIGKPTAGDEKVKNLVDWDAPGLKRAYRALTLLPKGHAADNVSLKKFQRYKGGGSGGWHGGEEIAIGYEALESVTQDPRSLVDKLKSRGTNVFIGKNQFDQTVRHEVGHAVDARKGFSDAYCIDKAPGGNWKKYGSALNMVQDFMTLKNSPLWNHPLFKGMAKLEVAKLLEDNPDVAAIKRATIKVMRDLGKAAAHALKPDEINFSDSLVNDDAVFVALAQPNLKKPWKTAESPAVAGRTFVYSNERTLSSYDATARARQVSNYQFRAPQEWFAEAYAAFYEPDETNKGYGSKLQTADNATYQYFVAEVDKAL